MSEIVPFVYGDHEVRTVTVDGDPWFVAADVCAVLGITKHRSALERIDPEDRGSARVDTPGGMQVMGTVNESGLYDLIIRSDKPEAKPFRRWVTSEVLPAIRRTGSYSVVPQPRSQIDVLRAALDQIEQAQAVATEAKAIAQHSEARLDAIEGKHDWFAALGYAKLQCWPTDRLWLQKLGYRAGSIGRAAGLPVSKVQHGLYGQVNQWPAWCWDQAYQDVSVENGSV